MNTPTPSLEGFEKLVDAEDYFRFFDLPFEPHVLAVNRLHILRHFADQITRLAAENGPAREDYPRYRAALETSYRLFETSSGIEQKLFKVFQERPGHIVTLGELEP